MGARCNTYQSNLPVARFWSDAEALFITSLLFFTRSRSDQRKMKSEARTGLRFESYRFPFGRLIHYKPDPKKLSHTHAPLSKPGLFLGWALGAGQRWTRLYKVQDYEALLKGTFGPF